MPVIRRARANYSPGQLGSKVSAGVVGLARASVAAARRGRALAPGAQLCLLHRRLCPSLRLREMNPAGIRFQPVKTRG